MNFKSATKSEIRRALLANDLIPLDKSWVLRMGALDLFNHHTDGMRWLAPQQGLSNDLQSLLRASSEWNTKKKIHIGESATLFRFLQFASWRMELDKKFVLEGTLKKRKITRDSKIAYFSVPELLKLDGGTSQWASAYVLYERRLFGINGRPKLELTYEAVEHWKERRGNGKLWLARYDKTIMEQALAYVDIVRARKPGWVAKHSEDYCFGIAFDKVSEKESRKNWPSLKNHESNRFDEMKIELARAKAGKKIRSKDHRVIQAIVMLRKSKDKDVEVKYPDSVNKSWPQFWDFIEFVDKLQG